jgi:cation diffusion facilitator family transporter
MTAAIEARKQRAATLSLAFNICSALLKVVGAVLTGSVSLLSEAMHSTTDVLSSFMALLSVRAASVPPDEEHPYGHGKIENLTAFGEAILLLGVVVYVLIEAIHRLIVGGLVEQLDVALAIMAVSTLGSLFTGIYVRKVARESRSMALEGNSQHLFVDFWTSLGVLVALLITRVTGWNQADSVLAILLAAFLGNEARKMAHETFHQIIDHKLPDEEIAQIRAILDAEQGLMNYHRLRSRLSGAVRYIDFHIVVPREWSVVQAHDLADRLEKTIQTELAPAVAVVHVDPFDPAKAGPKLTSETG